MSEPKVRHNLPGVNVIMARLKSGEVRAYYYCRTSRTRLIEAPGTPAFERELLALRTRGVRRTDDVEFVYFIRSTATGAIKIGKSVDPMKRLNAIQVSTCELVELLGCVPGARGGHLERDIQGRFKAHHIRGEWFAAAPELLRYIERNARMPGERKAA